MMRRTKQSSLQILVLVWWCGVYARAFQCNRYGLKSSVRSFQSANSPLSYSTYQDSPSISYPTTSIAMRATTHGFQERKETFPSRNRSQCSLSPLFAASASSPESPLKIGFFRQLQRICLLPLRWLILKPLKYLLEIFAEDLDLEDGTSPVSEKVGTMDYSSKQGFVSHTVRDDDDRFIQPIITVMAASPGAKIEFKELGEEEAIEAKKSIATKPIGKRWAVAASDVDLSGNWQLIVNDEFKSEYDQYLIDLGQPKLVRSVALGIIGLTTEETMQTDGGKSLLIRGKNARGIWDRTLVASGTENAVDEFTPLQISVMTADSEKVEAESWWENGGHEHVSWLRGVRKYGGGDFESRRYLDRDIYVCESFFHPNDKIKPPNQMTWRFRRQDIADNE